MPEEKQPRRYHVPAPALLPESVRRRQRRERLLLDRLKELQELQEEESLRGGELQIDNQIAEAKQRLGKQVTQKTTSDAEAAAEGALDYGYLSPRELADKHGLNAEMLRKRLDRWRKSHADGWTENANRKRTEAQFLYRPVSVEELIQKAKKASGKTSGIRPA